MKSAPTIAFDYRPSRWIGAAALLICAVAMLAPWLSALPPGLCAMVSLAVAALGTSVLRRYWSPRFRRIAYRASGWSLVDTSDVEHEAILETHTRLGALLALAFRHGPRARFRALLGPDNLDADTRRRLILLLASHPA